MKPTTPLVERENGRPSRRSFPVTDFQYHSVAVGGFGRCARRQGTGFHMISRDYFGTEANHHFLVDAGVFIAIMCAAAAPLLNGAHAVLGLLRAFGGI